MKGFFKVYTHILPMGLFCALAFFIPMVLISFVVPYLSSHGGSLDLQFIFFISVLIVFLVPLLFAVQYMRASSKYVGDRNRFERKHIRYIEHKLDLQLFKSKIEELGCFDIIQSGNKIEFKFPDIYEDNGHPGFPDWKRSRQAILSVENSQRILSVEPIRRVELLDFSLSNYYHLDKLYEALEW